MTVNAKIYDKANKHDKKSPLKGTVALVGAGLQAILQCDGDAGLVVPRVENCLAAAYPGKVVQSNLEVIYVYVWNGNNLCQKCIDIGTFEVDFGSDGVVVVEVEEGQHYKIP